MKTLFQKGRKKTGGRKTGTVNRKTARILNTIEKVLALLEKTLENDIQSLSPAKRVELWKDLQEYLRPKLYRTGIEVTKQENKLPPPPWLANLDGKKIDISEN